MGSLRSLVSGRGARFARPVCADLGYNYRAILFVCQIGLPKGLSSGQEGLASSARFVGIGKEFQSNSSQISLLLIVGGAIGNIIDRIFRGYVVDFIQFDIDIFPYVFNIADSSVTIGLLFLLCSSIIFQRR